jgi:hypothetical protein
MTDKTDAEFVAECEALWAQYEAIGPATDKGKQHEVEWMRGALLSRITEAIERLKRAKEQVSRKRSIQEFLEVMFLGVKDENKVYVSHEFFDELRDLLRSVLRYSEAPSPPKVGFDFPEIDYCGHKIRSPTHPEAFAHQWYLRLTAPDRIEENQKENEK